MRKEKVYEDVEVHDMSEMDKRSDRRNKGAEKEQNGPEFTQTHVDRVNDDSQPSHPLSSPSPPAPNPYQHQSLFQ